VYVVITINYVLIYSSFMLQGKMLFIKHYVFAFQNEIKQLVSQIENNQAEKDSLEIVPAPAQTVEVRWLVCNRELLVWYK